MSLPTDTGFAIRGVRVKYSEATTTSEQRHLNRERGFSMLELTVVISILLILSAMAIFQLQPALQAEHANAALREVLDEMRTARELAISNRRWVAITFPVVVHVGVTENRVQVVIKNTLTTGAGADQALPPVPIERPIAFYVYPAPVTDTPDGFGNGSPIEFGGVANGPVGGMLFDSNGEMVNGTTYLPINGSVFLGTAGQASSVRAVTVMGTSGRVRGWSWTGAAWKQF
jgi:prepilin-type N-terminal cleavage/methylation domain-containing protein